MWTFTKPKAEMPAESAALPGRSEIMPVSESHYVLNTPLKPPFPQSCRLALFGLGCFWGAERKFWKVPGVHSTSVGYAAGFTPNASYEEVCTGKTGHNEVVRVVFDPMAVTFEALLKVFWESHDPTQGMRQGNDVGTQYRSGIYVYDAAQRTAAEAVARHLPTPVVESRIRGDHDGNHRRAGVLLRRGLSPAVSGQEPDGLLRPRRHRGRLPRRLSPSRPVTRRCRTG